MKLFLVCKFILFFIVLCGIFFSTFGRKFLNESFQSEHGMYQRGNHRIWHGQNCGRSCRYVCSNPVVEQEEKAVCKPAQCEVLCNEIESAKCTVTAPTPKCRNVCYKSEGKCNSGKCPRCYSVCDSPIKPVVKCCKPKPVGKTVCKKPDCRFVYSKPSKVPKPKCTLKCDKDENLLNKVGF